MCVEQEKQAYLKELEELIPQMETLIQDKDALDQQASHTTPPGSCAMLCLALLP